MKSLGQALRDSMADVYVLTENDKRFIASFGSPGKPVSLAEFLRFWGTLSEAEKTAIMLDYEPEMTTSDQA